MKGHDKLNKNPAPDSLLFSKLIKKIDFKIDEDYLGFIKGHNGAEGKIGRENYILLWEVEDLISLNPYYEESEVCADLFFFGTDGSNLGYAIEKSSGKVVGIDFLDIGEVNPTFVAASFSHFLQKLIDNRH